VPTPQNEYFNCLTLYAKVNSYHIYFILPLRHSEKKSSSDGKQTDNGSLKNARSPFRIPRDEQNTSVGESTELPSILSTRNTSTFTSNAKSCPGRDRWTRRLPQRWWKARHAPEEGRPRWDWWTRRLPRRWWEARCAHEGGRPRWDWWTRTRLSRRQWSRRLRAYRQVGRAGLRMPRDAPERIADCP